jgi:hypothetical protein
MKTSAGIQKSPEMGMIGPAWCHHHGSKMRVSKGPETNSRSVVISGSAAWLEIFRFPVTTGASWRVEWKIAFSQDSKAGGCISMTTEELRAAFGLSNMSGHFGDWLIECYGADAAEQGKFIRWGNFLNIPGPGTGHDGDPNISIHIDDKIKETVGKLLADI